jgi:DNA-binding transcriptional ArsR family regulator
MDAFQALADPTRRQVIAALRRGERQVNDIVEELDIHQSGVSRHLRILLQSGFVAVRPDGQLRLYSLRPQPFREMEQWLADYLQVWEGRLQRFDTALEANKSTRTKTDRKRSPT